MNIKRKVPNNFWESKLEHALTKMPNKFTTHFFNDYARGLGVDSNYLLHGGGGRFLKDKCEHLDRTTWCKISEKSIEKDKNFEEECIEYLKDLGYKIYKQAYVEV